MFCIKIKKKINFDKYFSSCPPLSLDEKKNRELIQSLKWTSFKSFPNKKLLREIPYSILEINKFILEINKFIFPKRKFIL